MHKISRYCYLASCVAFAPALSAASCDDLALTFAVTKADNHRIKIQCPGQAQSCLSRARQQLLQVRQAAALHRFLGICQDPEHPNYQLAQAQLLPLLMPQLATAGGAAPGAAAPGTAAGTAAAAPSAPGSAVPLLAAAAAQPAANAPALTPAPTANKAAGQAAAAGTPAAPAALKIKLQSDKPWLSSLSVGSQYLPDYRNDKTNHLSHAQAFAEVIVDYRQAEPDSLFAKGHWGTFLQLEGTPVVRKDAKNAADLKFNDVSQSLSAGVYMLRRVDVPWLPSIKGTLDGNELYDHYTSEWFVGGKFSVRQRDSIGEGQDGIDPIAEIGLQYRYSEFKGTLAGGNVMPRGSLSLGLGYWDAYEDVFGVTAASNPLHGDLVASRWRYLIRGEYRLADTIPFYLGFKGNLGKGPDTLGLYLSLRMNAEQFLGVFTETAAKPSASPAQQAATK